MMRAIAIIVAFIVPGLVLAQEDIEVTTLAPVDPTIVVEEELPEEKVEVPTRTIDQVLLRGIDKLDGTAADFIVGNQLPRKFGLLSITMTECRYPEDNPTGEAFAFLTITEGEDTVFRGWMIASSPALNALDHQRYDVWVLRCRVSDTVGGAE